jgi:asparaginyl-tRNA synthetase
LTDADDLELVKVHGDRPVVLQYYPASMKGFHAKACADRPELSQTHDILMPRVGEVASAGIREEDLHRVEGLVGRPEYQQLLRNVGVDPAGHDWYMDLRRYGSAPHGGFGMGIERLLRWITGAPDMTPTIPFPRTGDRYDP